MNVSHFANNLGAWRQSQAQPWNRLRYLLVEQNLLPLLGEGAPRRVLDVGGGDGRDALPLAQRGHHVTLLDYVPEMLVEAERGATVAGVANFIHTQQVDLAAGDLPVAPGAFDLVLCHNVLQYLPDPRALLQAIGGVLQPGGWLSLLVPNPASEALRLALQQHDLPAAFASLDATTHRNLLFDTEVQLIERPVLWTLLVAAGLTPVDYYGIRCVNDYIRDDAIKFSVEGFGRLLALEGAMGQRSPYRDIARLWQIMARKPAQAG